MATGAIVTMHLGILVYLWLISNLNNNICSDIYKTTFHKVAKIIMLNNLANFIICVKTFFCLPSQCHSVYVYFVKVDCFHRESRKHIQSSGFWSITDMTILHNGFTIFSIHLKHSSFPRSADDKPMLNDLVHALRCQCMFALSRCILQSLWLFQETLTEVEGSVHQLTFFTN